MHFTPGSSLRQHWPAAVILAIAVIVTWLAYAPGQTGGKWFDDTVNLDGLREIQDADSATHFILSGRAGPTGRPLALASFAAQSYAWADGTEILLRTNILIHLVNGMLVIWLLYLLGLGRKADERQAALVAVTSGALWMLLPILASSSLLIVQRMTTLSATFMLLGGIGYLYARRRIERQPLLALAGMTVVLGLAASLAMLAKENGVLLLLYVLAMETTLLAPPRAIPRRLWQAWFALVLVLPVIILGVFLVNQMPYPESVVLVRDFNGTERLLTQAHVLWKYLFVALAPNLPSLGPFHDDLQVQRSAMEIGTIIAVSSWVIVIAAAIAVRRRAPLFAFAVAWYLLGHSLESTTVPLELYFEHRNYLPMVGPMYALAAAAFAAAAPLRRYLLAGIAAYSLVLASLLYSVSSLWGEPAIAMEMWYIYRPASIRAAEVLATEMGKSGLPDVERKILREVGEKNPDNHLLDLRILSISCQIEPKADYSAEIRSLAERFRTTRFSFAAVGMLWGLDHIMKSGNCPQLPADSVDRLAKSLLANPRYESHLVRANLHIILAQTATGRGERHLTEEHVRQALSLAPSPETLAAAVEVLDEAGLHDQARQLITEAKNQVPGHPIRARLWTVAVEKLEEAQGDRRQ